MPCRENIKLNIGSGGKSQPGFQSVDNRKLPGVIQCQMWDLSKWNDESVSEIYSRHALEHVSRTNATRTVAEWFQKLQGGGKLQVIVPDLIYHAKQLLGLVSRYGDSRDIEHAMSSFYGWNSKQLGGDTDTHQWGYTSPSLCKLLTDAGFRNITRVLTGKDSEPWHLNLVALK